MSPVRVLLIAPSLDILGGQAVQAKRLLDGLRKEPSVQVDFLPTNPRLPGVLRNLQLVKYLRTLSTFAVFNARLLATAWRYDVLHIFTAAYYSFLLWSVPSILIGRLYGRKIVLDYHDGQCEDHLRNWRIAVPALRWVDQIVAPSEFLVDVMKPFGLQAQAICNSLDVDNFHYRMRSRLRPVFMTNRGLEPLYNVGCILRAFKIIQGRYNEASLTIAHDGPCRARLETLARELKLDNVQFAGSIPLDRVPALYDSADIYLTSPNIDNMPVSVLECFASGLPVIATNTGGIPYILTHESTGLLVPVNDHEALARAAFRLLEDSDLVERITRNAHQEVERYRWSEIGGQWVELYHRLAAET